MSLPDPAQTAPPRRSPIRRVLTAALSVALPVAVIAVVVMVLGDAVPSPRVVVDAVSGAHGWWVAAAVLLQGLSMLMLSMQQRQLLGVLGTPVGPGRMAAITVASTAVSLTVPAGGAVGAGWSFRQYRLAGATRAAASTVTVVSGLAGAAGLATLVALMWTTFKIVHLAAPGQQGLLVTCLVLMMQSAVLGGAWAVWSWWRRRHGRSAARPAEECTGRERRPAAGRLAQRIGHEVRSALAVTRSLGPRGWRNATAASVPTACWTPPASTPAAWHWASR